MKTEAFNKKIRLRSWNPLRNLLNDPFIFKRLNVFILCVLLLGGWFIGKYSILKEEALPLLLNSGLTEVRQAEVRVVLWFESEEPPEKLKGRLPQEGWEWNESYLETSDQKRSYTLSGLTRIENRDEEGRLSTWYKEIASEVKKYHGIAYLDERISEEMDIAMYSMKHNILPAQWALLGYSNSMTGFLKQEANTVKAGLDPVNIQLITESHDGRGRTALAIPVLLEEF